ncbi:hypothetical protein EGJ15_05800 [Pseudomonas sp. p99-361]|nr:hypothetical protein EGJ15_05800 [Pseudomonas sp. p99-361]
MRTNLNQRSSAELLEIMQHYGFTSTNHTLNVIISTLYESLFNQSHKNPNIEVNTNDEHGNNR